MPYINQKARKELKTRSSKNMGELNYQITKFCHQYIKDNKPIYYHYNKIRGALAVVKDVFKGLNVPTTVISQQIIDIVCSFNLNAIGVLTIKDYPDHFEDIMGVLDNVRSEFYRRKVGPYEDGAIQRNGDVD